MAKPETCRFAKTHEWVHVQEGAATVGVSDHAQREITDVVFVELPKAGRRVRQGEPCGVVESVKAAFDIYAPVSGEITAINEALAQDPALVNRSPFDEGWLFKIKVADPHQASQLMDWRQYEEFIKTAAGHAGH